ncbi:TPA: Dot/Icm T4SS effector LegA1 [Legionella pneumophila]|nr:Dot/Icm T4SS effector LegA1 [Legionella pneumophila]HAT1882648.1 Dot/Icm T4SS effector LegA1 [Legionella pneumophila]HAT2114538.1 Dot/Icm T4SS effector LegA1 [Legionella pneumophila]HAT8719101.1 Dot/Icm T4SS effector LegA1 [Legionella pneumophila]
MCNLTIHNIENYENDPQLRLIPWILWENLFQHFISAYELSLMTLSYKEAIHIFLPGTKNMEQVRQLLCLYYAHYNRNAKQLWSDAHKKGIKSEVICFVAAITGCSSALDTLCLPLTSDEIVKVIQAENYQAFRLAAENGHIHVLNRLCELAPTEIMAMIKADNYHAFRLAAENGHIHVLNHLCELAPSEVTAMIQAENYYAFRWAAVGIGHHEVINFLLDCPVMLAYAEIHEFEYGEKYVNPFIARHVNRLKEMRDAFKQSNPDGVFDLVTKSECLQGFYMLRNLIRRNDEALLDDIRFLLSIPGIKALAPAGTTPGNENELLRLALQLGNQGACALLLSIPSVLALTKANNYYIDETGGRLDLRAVA